MDPSPVLLQHFRDIVSGGPHSIHDMHLEKGEPIRIGNPYKRLCLEDTRTIHRHIRRRQFAMTAAPQRTRGPHQFRLLRQRDLRAAEGSQPNPGGRSRYERNSSVSFKSTSSSICESAIQLNSQHPPQPPNTVAGGGRNGAAETQATCLSSTGWNRPSPFRSQLHSVETERFRRMRAAQ